MIRQIQFDDLNALNLVAVRAFTRPLDQFAAELAMTPENNFDDLDRFQVLALEWNRFRFALVQYRGGTPLTTQLWIPQETADSAGGDVVADELADRLGLSETEITWCRQRE